MKKKIEIKFDEEAYKEYEELKNFVKEGKKAKKKPTYEQLLSSINNTIKHLEENPYYGDLVPKKYLSKGIINRYGTDKIFRIELIGFWRLLYTTIGDETTIIALILEYMDHDKYNKIFGYKKK